MSFSSLRTRMRASFGIPALALGILLCPVAAVAELAADTIVVNVDQAKLVKLPGRISTLVVGNPLIADVTLQNGGIVVVTGKGYGATNFIAMDRAGEILMDRIIQVEGPTDQVVTIYRGVERESYSCMPVCQRRVTLGDAKLSGRVPHRGPCPLSRPRIDPGSHAAAWKMVSGRLTERATLLRFHGTLQQSLSGSFLRVDIRCRLGKFSMLSTASVRNAVRRFRRNRRGSAAVEFALVAPVFFALLFAIIESAMVFFAGQVLETGVTSVLT